MFTKYVSVVEFRYYCVSFNFTLFVNVRSRLVNKTYFCFYVFMLRMARIDAVNYMLSSDFVFLSILLWSD